MQSIISNDRVCYLSGRTDMLEKHHIYGGANRKLSEKYGLWVYLNHYYHNEPPDGVHFNKQNMDRLRKDGQIAFNEHYPDLNFIEIFGKNYL